MSRTRRALTTTTANNVPNALAAGGYLSSGTLLALCALMILGHNGQLDATPVLGVLLAFVLVIMITGALWAAAWVANRLAWFITRRQR